MSYGSPYASSTPRGDYNYYSSHSPSPTPSPHHYTTYYTAAKTPQRPATRAHVRGASSGYTEFRPSTAFSPRYKSTGEYATGPSPKVSSTRKQSFSRVTHDYHHPPKRENRRSYSYFRASYGDSDEDEVVEVDGITYVTLAKPGWWTRGDRHHYAAAAAAGHATDHYYYPQVHPVYHDKERTRHVRHEDLPQRAATKLGHHAPRTHTRHSSVNVNPTPVRPQTTRPSISQQKKTSAPVRKATQADADRHKMPKGLSLKNWDPTEEPIKLLGSIFDANSLGKWIYDWTVYHHGPGTPIADMAGELWLLLIQLSGKVKRSEEVVPVVRLRQNKEMLEDFIESGERLMDRLRDILKRCEEPMLRRQETDELNANSGIEFVETMFGRERELENAERFMQSVRLWNLRFDANCDDILKRPTA